MPRERRRGAARSGWRSVSWPLRFDCWPEARWYDGRMRGRRAWEVDGGKVCGLGSAARGPSPRSEPARRRSAARSCWTARYLHLLPILVPGSQRKTGWAGPAFLKRECGRSPALTRCSRPQPRLCGILGWPRASRTSSTLCRGRQRGGDGTGAGAGGAAPHNGRDL